MGSGNQGWLKSNLATLGTAAVLSVYAVGYARTREAAARFANETEQRRPARPAPSNAAPSGSAAAPERADTAAPKVAQQLPPLEHAAASKQESAKKRIAAADSDTKVPVAPAPASTSAPVAAVPDALAPAPAQPVASPAPAASTAPADTAHAVWKDGTYTGYGTSRHGDIEATVTIKEGKIIYAGISECLTRYSCSWISNLPPEVVQRQSADVDYVSGATQSSDAFYYAIVNALKKAK